MKYRVSVWVDDEKLSLVQLAHTFDNKFITWTVKNHPGTLFDDLEVARLELKKYLERTNKVGARAEIRSIQ